MSPKSHRLEGFHKLTGRCVDPLEGNLLESLAGGVLVHRLAQSNDTLLGTGDGALDHDEVVLDHTVADEATQRSDLLLGDIRLGRGAGLVASLGDPVNLVVHRGTVVVTVLTSTGNSPLDVGRVPCTDTGDLAKTWQILCQHEQSNENGLHSRATVLLRHS